MFFGVAQSRITQEAITQYNKIYLHASPKQKILLYDHLLFDTKRFLSEELEEMARNGEFMDPGALDGNPLPPAQPLPHPPIAQANPLSYF
uniref:Uncharacterized protein n=1 Tax=Ditylenchus dipsaci TaxID=166011 RepID=A0A915EKG0_9BILA